jgi:hypothetical protein
LGIGTAGQHLATNAGATAPEWVTPATVGGLPIKIWHANTTSQFSTTSQFGAATADGSIPQDTEGIPLLNLSITASATTNKLLFHFYATHGSTSTPSAATALFRTSGPNASADALFAAVGHVNEAAFGAWHTVESALTTTASNYQVRFARVNSGTVGANHMGGNTAENYSTASKINLTVVEYESYLKVTEYMEKRKKEYPSIEDQLDMIFWDKKNGTTKWEDAVQVIKDKYSK